MSRILLVGCGKSKRAERAAARDLYTGPLFADRRAYAEATGDPWWVLSARHGIVDPDRELRPYDETMEGKPPVDRAAWAVGVVLQLLTELPDDVDLRAVIVEIHAGEAYADQLADVLVAAGLSVDRPVRGLGIGEQRAWYRRGPGLNRMGAA